MALLHGQGLDGRTADLTGNPSEDEPQPGYCVFGCGFHMVTPVPGYSGVQGVCGNCQQAGRLALPPPPDRPRYAPRITWRQARRLQRTAAEFWDYGDGGKRGSPFGEFAASRPWRRLLGWLSARRALRRCRS